MHAASSLFHHSLRSQSLGCIAPLLRYQGYWIVNSELTPIEALPHAPEIKCHDCMQRRRPCNCADHKSGLHVVAT